MSNLSSRSKRVLISIQGAGAEHNTAHKLADRLKFAETDIERSLDFLELDGLIERTTKHSEPVQHYQTTGRGAETAVKVAFPLASEYDSDQCQECGEVKGDNSCACGCLCECDHDPALRLAEMETANYGSIQNGGVAVYDEAEMEAVRDEL